MSKKSKVLSVSSFFFWGGWGGSRRCFSAAAVAAALKATKKTARDRHQAPLPRPSIHPHGSGDVLDAFMESAMGPKTRAREERGSGARCCRRGGERGG